MYKLPTSLNNINEVTVASFKLFIKLLVPLFLPCLIAALLSTLTSYMHFNIRQLNLLKGSAMLIDVFFITLIISIAQWIAWEVMNNTWNSYKDAWRAFCNRVIALIIVAIVFYLVFLLIGLIVFMPFFIKKVSAVSIEYSLCIIYSAIFLYAFVNLSFCFPLVMIDEMNPLKALWHSKKLVKGHFWQTLSIFAITLVLAALLVVIGYYLFIRLVMPSGREYYFFDIFISTIVFIFCNAFYMMQFYNLKRKHG